MEMSSCEKVSKEVGLALGNESSRRGDFEYGGCNEVDEPSVVSEIY